MRLKSLTRCSLKKCVTFGIFLSVIYCGLSYYNFYYNRYVIKYRLAFDNINVHVSCNIPDLDAFDPSIRKYIYEPDPLQCSKNHEYTYIDNRGLLRMNDTAIKLSGQTLSHCEYKVIARPYDDTKNDITINYGAPVTFEDKTNIDGDFCKVTCYDSNSKPVYNNLHAHIKLKVNKLKTNLSTDKKNPNVLIIGLDSMSRLNMIRRMPQTYKYLTDNLDALVYKGFNSVGDCSMSNLYPMLMGLTDWYVDGSKYFFDPMPLIWKNYSRKGYVTMYSEDEPQYGTFNYMTKGFRDPPSDHYQRPFWLSLDDNDVINSLLSPVWQMAENSGMKFGKTSVFCFGRTPKHLLMLNYFHQFVKQYSKIPKFAFIWNNQLAHEWLNMVQIADDDYENVIKQMDMEGSLENTFLVVMGDHGHRFDWIRHTLIGRVEERMPFLAIVPPKWFKDKHPGPYEKLKTNTERLLSPYDLYEFLTDIYNNDYRDRAKPNQNGAPKRLSLFGTIPKTRSCHEAHIKEHFCACYGTKNIRVDSDTVQILANYIIEQINLETGRDRMKCAILKQNMVKTAYKIISGTQGPFEQYVVVVETLPGKGLFEATLKHYGNNVIELGGEISRINKYGNQSICTNIKALRKYCYCQQNVGGRELL